MTDAIRVSIYMARRIQLRTIDVTVNKHDQWHHWLRLTWSILSRNTIAQCLMGKFNPFFSPLSTPTCIIYGRFTALFGRSCCIALSANQTLSSGPCIIYGSFPATFVTVRSCKAWRHRSFLPLSGPTCISYGRFSALFRRPFINIYDQSNLVGTYVHFLWPFFGIVPSPFINIYDQSNLVDTYVHFLWPFFGIVPSPLH